VELRHAEQVTAIGALSLLLPRDLADRLEWWPWSEEIPAAAWDQLEKPKALFQGDRVALAFVLAGWNQTRVQRDPPQIVELFQRMDMVRVAEVIGYIWDAQRMKVWGMTRGPYLRPDLLTFERAKVRPEQALLFGNHKLAVMDGGQKAPFDRQAFDDARRPYSRWVCPECNERWNEDMNEAGFVASGFDLPVCPECNSPAADDLCLDGAR
jgi:hypothetical protein